MIGADAKMNIDQILRRSTASSSKARPRHTRGQAMLEFAMISTVVCICIFGGIQSAIIYNAYLAVDDLVYQGARYAAVNPGFAPSAVSTFMLSVASPIVMDNGGANLTITVTPGITPRAFGQTVTVNVTYSLANKLVLPNPFLGVTFPTIVSDQKSAMTE
jgi:Flp pilus assembly protein TadG